MIMKVQNVSCARGGTPLLEGLSFSLSAGQALILRGDNGIGKTTLLRSLAGLSSPFAGQIERDLDEVVYGAHLDGVKTALTVQENLQFWASVYGQISCHAALEAMNLLGLQHRLAAHLSAGQKRRLGLARFMVTASKIWIMDEPTVSLDGPSTELFQKMLTQHLEKGGIAILATHIDLGIVGARTLDLTLFRARHSAKYPIDPSNFDEALI